MTDEQGPPDNDFAPIEAGLPTLGAGVAVAVSEANATSAAILGARERAAIEARTVVAMRFPRTFEKARASILKACARVRFADSAIYAKPIGGKNKDGTDKTVDGLSIRFAEEFVRGWTNLDVGVQIVADTEDFIIIEAFAVDMETNTGLRQQARVPKYVERLSPRAGDEVISSRQNSRGKMTYKVRANEDALFTITQSAASKMWRTVALKHCPSDLAEEAEEACEKTLEALGNMKPEEMVKWLVEQFDKLGQSREKVEEFIGKPLTSVEAREFRRLRKLITALKTGEATWQELLDAKAEKLAAAAAPAEPGKGTAGLKKDLEKKAASAGDGVRVAPEGAQRSQATEEAKSAPAEPAAPAAGTTDRENIAGEPPRDPASLANVTLTEPAPAPIVGALESTVMPVVAEPVHETPAALTAEQLQARQAQQREAARATYVALMEKRARKEKFTPDEQTNLNRIRREYAEHLATWNERAE